ncbi:MAG: tetratricopeptide repeat protein [Cyanobacteria bacterium SZAS LIN-3]|nr:tetratricopeptide repeat protein [Cyanobacteria bacterium SZAS LIN-3]
MLKKDSSPNKFRQLALSLALVSIVSSLPARAEGELNADELNKLKLVEEKLFVRTYDDDAPGTRVERIEKRMFGEGSSGGLHERMSKIIEIAKPVEKPKTAPRGAGARPTASAAPSQPSAEELRMRQEDAREQMRQRAIAAKEEEVTQLLGEAVSLYKAQRGPEAMDKFQQVVRLAPDNAEAHFSIGVIYEAQRRYSDALKSYQRAAELNPDKRDYKEAVAIVQKKALVENDPVKAELKALAQQASEAYSLGEFQSALGLYKELDQKAPKQALVKYNIGTIYLALKNPVQALEYFQDAHKLKPEEPRFKEACEKLQSNLKHQQAERQAAEGGWQNPGKTVISFVNAGNNGGAGGGNNSSGGGKMTPLATSYGLMLRHNREGVEITTIGIGSRAAQCGLLKGDLIKAVDGVVVESTDQINQIFAAKPNAKFQLLVQRGTKIGQIVF